MKRDGESMAPELLARLYQPAGRLTVGALPSPQDPSTRAGRLKPKALIGSREARNSVELKERASIFGG